MINNNFVILNTTLDNNLINEGIVREFISKIQQLRKLRNFEMMDRIDIYYNGSIEFENSFKDYVEFIKKETLADEIIKKENLEEIYDLNGYNVYLEVNKK